MNALETNAANAAVNLLSLSTVLAAIPPKVWDTPTEIPLPHLSVKAVQGQEMVWNYGCYQVRIDVEYTCQATVANINAVAVDAEKLLAYNPNIQNRIDAPDVGGESVKGITDNHFFCFGRDSVVSSLENSGGNRVFKLTAVLIGFDLDRFS